MDQNTQMANEDLRAALGFSNNILAQSIPLDMETTPVEGELGAEMPQGGTETPDTANITDEITKGLKEAKTELKGELKDMIKSELKKLMDDEDEDKDNKETNE